MNVSSDATKKGPLTFIFYLKLVIDYSWILLFSPMYQPLEESSDSIVTITRPTPSNYSNT